MAQKQWGFKSVGASSQSRKWCQTLLVVITVFTSVLFTVKDNLRLDEARAALEEAGYAPVGTYERTKPYAIIDDEIGRAHV